MGLVETKMRKPNLEAFMARMLLLWNPQTTVLEVVNTEQQAIHTKIRCIRSRNSFLFSLVYGLHSPETRQPLWDSMLDFGLQGLPYLVSGDFNAVVHVDERRGFRKPDNREMDGPIQACAILGLQDVPSTGCFFTWTNGHVFSKIDRAKEFSDISAWAKEATKQLEELQLKADRDTSNRALQDQIRLLKQKTELLVTSEKNFYSQKAGLKHRLLSDRNTAFFHAMVRTNNTRNTIALLCKPDGSLIEDQDKIADSFVHFYNGLFGVPKDATPLIPEVIRTGYTLNDDESLSLIRGVSDMEIKKALFSIKDDKAPGPDGYSSAFFKKNWGTVGADLTNAALEFFESGHLLKSFNTTAIALIPKTASSPQVLGHQRLVPCAEIPKAKSALVFWQA
ncbi:uncharacterized protein LOC125199446 [Salvia hispanica]|uniref:uncharacterized protein LOC125199446 n=1 Tax=Salvia hispanica TaxID=49212 RepID=UPI0020092732|nr:uncharacterized protein LOC125199446 [Salvia hispanica]